MSQTYTVDVYAGSHNGATDLQNIEDNFATLKSNFSGTSAPGTTVPGMLWYDTTNKILKVRNQADDGWLGLQSGNTSHKTWVYSNSAIEGWTLDSSVTDKILAVKGGSYAYNVSGGGTAGTWTVSGITVSEHNHSLTSNEHRHTSGDVVYSGSGFLLGSGYYTDYKGSSATTTGNATPTASQDATWRAAAAVGTLQYLNVT